MRAKSMKQIRQIKIDEKDHHRVNSQGALDSSTVLGRSQMRKSCLNSTSLQTYDSAIISLKQLEAIRSESQLVTPVSTQQKQSLENQMARRTLAKTHRQTIQHFSSKPIATPQNLAVMQFEENGLETVQSRAQKLLDEDYDDTKQMNKYILNAQVLTIRDRQLQESKDLEREYLT